MINFLVKEPLSLEHFRLAFDRLFITYKLTPTDNIAIQQAINGSSKNFFLRLLIKVVKNLNFNRNVRLFYIGSLFFITALLLILAKFKSKRMQAQCYMLIVFILLSVKMFIGYDMAIDISEIQSNNHQAHVNTVPPVDGNFTDYTKIARYYPPVAFCIDLSVALLMMGTAIYVFISRMRPLFRFAFTFLYSLIITVSVLILSFHVWLAAEFTEPSKYLQTAVGGVRFCLIRGPLLLLAIYLAVVIINFIVCLLMNLTCGLRTIGCRVKSFSELILCVLYPFKRCLGFFIGLAAVVFKSVPDLYFSSFMRSESLVSTNDGKSESLVSTNDGKSESLISTNDGKSESLVSTDDGRSESLISTNDGKSESLISTNMKGNSPEIIHVKTKTPDYTVSKESTLKN